MTENARALPDQGARDLRWGYNCDRCETRMNAGQAEIMARDVKDDEPLLCGSCVDEERAANTIADLKVERDSARGLLAKASDEIDRLRTENERLRLAHPRRDRAAS